MSVSKCFNIWAKLNLDKPLMDEQHNGFFSWITFSTGPCFIVLNY